MKALLTIITVLFLVSFVSATDQLELSLDNFDSSQPDIILDFPDNEPQTPEPPTTPTPNSNTGGGSSSKPKITILGGGNPIYNQCVLDSWTSAENYYANSDLFGAMKSIANPQYQLCADMSVRIWLGYYDFLDRQGYYDN